VSTEGARQEFEKSEGVRCVSESENEKTEGLRCGADRECERSELEHRRCECDAPEERSTRSREASRCERSEHEKLEEFRGGSEANTRRTKFFEGAAPLPCLYSIRLYL